MRAQKLSSALNNPAWHNVPAVKSRPRSRNSRRTPQHSRPAADRRRPGTIPRHSSRGAASRAREKALMLTVVAALIHSDGKLLVCQRKRGTSFAMMWEFPGGKVKPGETLEQALARELEEELGTKATIGPEALPHATSLRRNERTDRTHFFPRTSRSRQSTQSGLRTNRLAAARPRYRP